MDLIALYLQKKVKRIFNFEIFEVHIIITEIAMSFKKGEKALEERLVQLVESTSESIGKIINVEVLGENVEFLGEWFGESEKEVILPAKLSKKEDKITISTRKFVRIPNGEEPKMILKIHEKLRGNSEPQEAKIISVEKIELSQKDVIDAHNLKKLRSAMNLISGSVQLLLLFICKKWGRSVKIWPGTIDKKKFNYSFVSRFFKFNFVHSSSYGRF